MTTSAPTRLRAGPRFRAGAPGLPWARALEVDGAGRIARVHAEIPEGSSPELLPGALALPGLHDAHLHLDLLGAREEEVVLDGARSTAEVRARVAAFAEARPELPFVRGRGWDQSLFPGGAFPAATDLAGAAGAAPRPILLTRVDGHADWVDPSLLALAGIGPETADPPGGQILRDAEGTPIGVLLDRAMDLVRRHLPPPGRDALRRRLLAGARAAARAGLTSVHAMSVDAASAEVLLDLAREGALPIRVFAFLQGDREESFDFLAEAPPSTGLLAFSGVKLFADGALGSRGAALLDDYADRCGCRGLLLHPPDELSALAARAHRLGLQVAIHAIGDLGNRVALDALEALPAPPPGAPSPRHRIEHAQVLHPDDLDRFASLGVVASMQPSHAAGDLRWAAERLGEGRLRGAYAWRALLDRGVVLAFGSDAPIETERPGHGIHAATTRRSPDGAGPLPGETLSVEEAIDAYTSGAAFAVRSERTLGRLAPGFTCDLTIFSDDPMTPPAPPAGPDPSAWLRTGIAARVVGGRVTLPEAP